MKQSSQIEYEEQRTGLLQALQAAEVSDRVTSAVMQVPRDLFVPPGLRRSAWTDKSLPIGKGQTISQPSLVGRMIDLLETEPHHRILDVGTGSGYQAAVLSLLVETVVSVERVPALCIKATALLQELGYRNVQVFDSSDVLGSPGMAPFDGIIVGAASPEIPESLVQQLKVGARLVIPVGSRDEQELIVIERTGTGTKQEFHEPVRFVPLIGKGAWNS